MPRRPRRTRYRKMPINLQILIFKKRFLKANVQFWDTHAELDNIDWEATLDKTCNFEENLASLEKNYPQYRWRRSRKKKVSRRTVWQSRFDSKSNRFFYSTKVVIKCHNVKAKSRTYLHGRIQVTVDKKWIGHKAKIFVRIPAEI